MKKQLLTTAFLIFFICASISLKAQWGGSNPLVTSNNVNINSAGNDATLDVGGPGGDSATVQITGPQSFSSGYRGLLRVRGQNLTYSMIAGWHWAYAPYFIVSTNGYVGIGTEAPLSKFHVVGTTLLEGNTDI